MKGLLLALKPQAGQGVPSWTGYYCTSVVNSMTHVHTCSRPRSEPHYQHECQDCKFRWAE